MLVAVAGCSSHNSVDNKQRPSKQPVVTSTALDAGIVSPPATVRAKVDAIAEPMIGSRTTGMVVAVSYKGKVLTRAYGEAVVETHQPMKPDTVFRIGSLTKQFTAASVLKLVERKKLALDDPIKRYLPEAPAKVTIRQLLSHTAGIHEYTIDPKFRAIPKPLTLAKLVDFICNQPLDFPPGSQWRYSNSGYVLLGVLIQRLSKLDYASFVQREIFAPLGLRDTRYCPDEPTGPRQAHGYVAKGGKLTPSRHIHMVGAFSAGALCSTAGDLLAWFTALLRKRVIGKPRLIQMLSPAKLSNGQPLAYGFGIQLQRVKGHGRLGHAGGISGFSAHIARYPQPGDGNLTVVVLSNTETAHAQDIATRIALTILD